MNKSEKSLSRSYSAKGRYLGKSAEQRQGERRNQLIETLIDLVGEHGYASISLNQVCTEAGLIKRYFYESFDSLDQLLVEAFRRVLEELRQDLVRQIASQTTPREMIVHSIRGFYEYLKSHPARGRLFLIESLSVPSTRSIFVNEREIAALMMLSAEPFVNQAKLSQPVLVLMAQSALGAVRFIGQKWIETHYEQPLDELVEGVSEVCFGIADRLGVKLDVPVHAEGALKSDL